LALRMAFAGFRHGHILDMYQRAGASENVEITAASEPDDATRSSLAGQVGFTHTDHRRMLDEVECDVLAVGDYYGARGGICIQALESGKHVIADKPICTTLDELYRIRELAQARKLKVGCMLNLRELGGYIRLRELILDGAIGEVHTINIGGQHPLMPESRPGWYFEQGKHGGTINDIGIHAFDVIRWLTNMEFAEIVAARSWNAFAKHAPHFDDCGQFIARLENGCGVMGDMSYAQPGPVGYSTDLYWRITIFGSLGILEASANSNSVRMLTLAGGQWEEIPPAPGVPGGYLQAFIDDVAGKEAAPDTTEILKSSLVALATQQAGLTGECQIDMAEMLSDFATKA
jgi:predicted dehydrogenase